MRIQQIYKLIDQFFKKNNIRPTRIILPVKDFDEFTETVNYDAGVYQKSRYRTKSHYVRGVEIVKGTAARKLIKMEK